MYFPGDTLHSDVTERLSDSHPLYGKVPAYTIATMPGMIGHHATRTLLTPEATPFNQGLTDALFDLYDHGIEFPGISSLLTRDTVPSLFEYVRIYTTTHIVDGPNMHHEMEQVPLAVTVKTFENILSYYEDMTCDFSGKPYLTDVSLRQCVYGHCLGEGAVDDGQPHATFVDLGPYLNNIQHLVLSRPSRGLGTSGIGGLDDDLYALKKNYPDQQFDQLAVRLYTIARDLGVFHRIPTAWEQVSDLADQEENAGAKIDSSQRPL